VSVARSGDLLPELGELGELDECGYQSETVHQ